ncbi:unnamed protein product [Rotaria magnacalcarata]|uniref:Nuclear receptor domain-containing protein n=1 Tax=Rotaria magnacalcarata TaxID=392030 RepID=A0A820BP43_9BILA|nr:unnamed protein product [Rotaria magnacalcarata]CAF3802031.1 unnamed protein product [Rotaria magnacalcarata]CAF3959743.1 unnamed protein product [Rotaria magnacalcarata]CAF4194996.1 unnamed protein product [Rotaria magnacalcarata]
MGILQCHNRYKCIITKTTRIKCPACRLQKCVLVGMNQKLIRSTHQLQIVLDNDQQSLIENKSEAISSKVNNGPYFRIKFINITNKNFIHNGKFIHDKQSSLPPKLRLK